MGEYLERRETDPAAESLREATTRVAELEGYLMRAMLGADALFDYQLKVVIDEEIESGLTPDQRELRDDVFRSLQELERPAPGVEPGDVFFTDTTYHDAAINEAFGFGQIGNVETDPLQEKYDDAYMDMQTLVDGSFDTILLESVTVPAFRLAGDEAVGPGRLSLMTYMSSSPDARPGDILVQIKYSVVDPDEGKPGDPEVVTELFVHVAGIEWGLPVLKQILEPGAYELMMGEIQTTFLQRAIHQLNTAVSPTLQAAIEAEGLKEHLSRATS